jgi:hypothetical protein
MDSRSMALFKKHSQFAAEFDFADIDAGCPVEGQTWPREIRRRAAKYVMHMAKQVTCREPKTRHT